MKIVIKIKPLDFSKLFELRDVACMIAEEEERQEMALMSGQKRAALQSSCCRPFKKLRFSDEEEKKLHGWAELMTRMCGISFPLASGQKLLTKTDVRAKSNRFLFPLQVRETLSREMPEWEKRKTHDRQLLFLEEGLRLYGHLSQAGIPRIHWRPLVDSTIGASYNALADYGRKYLLPAFFNYSASKCLTLV